MPPIASLKARLILLSILPPVKFAPHSNLLQKGFTLVETVLAVGIVAFAFVGIAGLLPCGMQSFRRAMDNTMQAQMTQNIVAQASQKAFSDLSKLDGQDFYFDDNGDTVDSSSPLRTYTARVKLTSQLDVPGATSAYTNPGLAKLTVTYYRPSPQAGVALGQSVTYIANKAGDLAE